MKGGRVCSLQIANADCSLGPRAQLQGSAVRLQIAGCKCSVQRAGLSCFCKGNPKKRPLTPQNTQGPGPSADPRLQMQIATGVTTMDTRITLDALVAARGPQPQRQRSGRDSASGVALRSGESLWSLVHKALVIHLVTDTVSATAMHQCAARSLSHRTHEFALYSHTHVPLVVARLLSHTYVPLVGLVATTQSHTRPPCWSRRHYSVIHTNNKRQHVQATSSASHVQHSRGPIPDHHSAKEHPEAVL